MFKEYIKFHQNDFQSRWDSWILEVDFGPNAQNCALFLLNIQLSFQVACLIPLISESIWRIGQFRLLFKAKIRILKNPLFLSRSARRPTRKQQHMQRDSVILPLIYEYFWLLQEVIFNYNVSAKASR